MFALFQMSKFIKDKIFNTWTSSHEKFKYSSDYISKYSSS